MKSNLSEADVSRLLADPSETSRAAVAAKVAETMAAEDLSEGERRLAEQIVRIMVKDAAVRVREALSQSLKANDKLPRDVALALAHDVEAVALPMLESSTVLTDEDLVEIVQAANAAKQTAIAGRTAVSATVASALIDSENPSAVNRLVGNDGAQLSEAALQTVLDRYADTEPVKDAMVHRGALPITVAERLVAMVSATLRDYLVVHHELSPALAADMLMESRERATVGLLPPGAQDIDVQAMVRQMMVSGRLTPSIVLRALCLGDLAFFEASLAALARLPLLNARLLILDDGALGLVALYRRANLPQRMYPAFRVALDVARQTEYDGGDNDRPRFAARMIQRILTQFEDIAADDLDYLLRKLNQMAA